MTIRTNGKVLETVTTNSIFTAITGWNSRTVKKLGHTLNEVWIQGQEASAHQNWLKCTITVDKDFDIPIHRREHDRMYGLKVPGGRFAKIVNGLIKQLPHFKFYIIKFNTTNDSTGDVCMWQKSGKLGDEGQYKMLLTSINETSVMELSEKDILIASDGMYWDGCKYEPQAKADALACDIKLTPKVQRHITKRKAIIKRKEVTL